MCNLWSTGGGKKDKKHKGAEIRSLLQDRVSTVGLVVLGGTWYHWLPDIFYLKLQVALIQGTPESHSPVASPLVRDRVGTGFHDRILTRSDSPSDQLSFVQVVIFLAVCTPWSW